MQFFVVELNKAIFSSFYNFVAAIKSIYSARRNFSVRNILFL